MSDTNKSIIKSYLAGKGLSMKAIAGVMGNIQQESNFDTTATNSSSGAYGLFQWLRSRKTALQNYAKSVNKDVSDITTQLDFFWHELNTTQKATLTALEKNYATAGKYAEVFENKFERSGGSGMTNRKNYAENIYLELASGIDTDIMQTNPINTNSGGLTWWGDIVKVVFVLLLIVTGVIFGAVSINSTVEEFV